MTDILLPPWLRIARSRIGYLDSTGMSRGEFTGKLKTASKGGDRLSASVEFSPTISRGESAMERAALISFLASLRGRQNRVYMTDHSYVKRGSFPATELLTNNTFENGTTGWAIYKSTLSVIDRVLRAKSDGATADFGVTRAGVSVSQYVPYVFRAAFPSSRIFTPELIAEIQSGGVIVATTSQSFSGMPTASLVTNGTAATVYAWHNSGGGERASRCLDVSYLSLSRCALVDNGPNSGLRSDELDNAAWTKNNSSAVANQHTAADGTVTADQWIENSSSAYHSVAPASQISRSSVAEDWCTYGVFGRSSGTRNVMLLLGSDSSNYSTCVFDLGAGTVGTPSNVGTNTNARGFIISLGSGLYACYLVARLAASSQVYREYAIANGTSTTYLGNGTSALISWRMGAARSSLPVRLTQTTSAASSGSNQTGSALYIKGLPASTNGLLLRGDQFEVITSYGSELKLVIAPLNSDAAGLGYLQFEPPLRGVPADNAPIIIHEPMGKFVFTGEQAGWNHEPGVVTRASAEFEEA